MQRKVPFMAGEYYHVYNRGVDKRIIFNTKHDYGRFVLLLHVLNTGKDIKVRDLLKGSSPDELIETKNDDPIVAIGAYCLMPNHFHLLLTPLIDGGITKFMLKLQTSYSMYFNLKNKRSGSLFQGPFKAGYLDSDEYLKYIYSYIHLNPAKLKDKNWKDDGPRDFYSLKNFIINYKYSSISEYLTNNFVIIDPSFFPDYRNLHKSKKDYFRSMVDEWLNYRGKYTYTQGSPVYMKKFNVETF